MTAQAKTAQLLTDLIAQASEYNRRGDVVLRNQTIRSIEEAAPTRAAAKKAIAAVYAKAAI